MTDPHAPSPIRERFEPALWPEPWAWVERPAPELLPGDNATPPEDE